MDNLSLFLGMMKKAGQLSIGEEPVGASCRARKASLLITASDAASNTLRRAAHFSEIGGGIPIVSVPLDKSMLGAAVGRSSCAVAAITDIGFASTLLKKLSALDPDQYQDTAQVLHHKTAKVAQRKKERRAHEKNLLRGQKKKRS